MKVKIYRIDNGVLGKAFRILRKSDLPISGVSRLCGSVSRVIGDYFASENIYVIDNKQELNRFENALGNSWIEKEQYYIRHPKKSRERMLIEADKFHEYIYREQLSEIISFLRSELNIKHLKIEIIEGNSFSSYINVPIEEIPVEGKASINLHNSKIIEIKCEEGLKRSEKRTEYIWLQDFQELLSVVDNFEKGTFKNIITIDNSFGITGKIASLAGIGTAWIKKSKFEISFTA